MPVKITVDDIRAAGFCVDGLRMWTETNGLDLRRLVQGGYSVEDVAHIDDANAALVKAIAVSRANS